MRVSTVLYFVCIGLLGVEASLSAQAYVTVSNTTYYVCQSSPVPGGSCGDSRG